MAILTLARLHELLAYDPETGVFRWKTPTSNRVRAGSVAGVACSASGYVRIRLDGVLFHAHRLAWFYLHGYWPVEVDHRNRVRTDNRISNLREVTHTQNMQNMPMLSTNTSGTTGVYWERTRSKWVARLEANGKKHSLGYHDTYEAAVAARRAGEARWHQN